MSKNNLGIVFFPAYDWEISPTHPERQERLLYTQDQLLEEGVEDIGNISYHNPTVATDTDISMTHFVIPSVEKVLTQSHKVAVGGAIKAFELILDPNIDKSFAMVRPPGHHAFKTVYGDRGFCIVNIEAVALEHIRRTKDLKVAIVDTDAHHGDGTQDIYWNDPNTLFISIHQDGRTLFPGSGHYDERGGPGAYGHTVNIPLPPGTGDEGLHYAIEHAVLPILEDYQPDIIINSAGQDNHYSDPLTNMNVSAQGYATLTQMLDPDIVVLEGGYEVQGALPYVNLGLVLSLAGLDSSGVVEPDYYDQNRSEDPQNMAYIKELVDLTIENWNNKEADKEALIKDKSEITRNKRIYYDTDGIMEHQKETITVCDKCPGITVLDSTTDTGYHALAISIPRDGCTECESKAQEIYKNAGGYTGVYLQDKKNLKYHSK